MRSKYYQYASTEQQYVVEMALIALDKGELLCTDIKKDLEGNKIFDFISKEKGDFGIVCRMGL